MRPNIARALTAALATAGAAVAIVLPTLTVGEVKSPPHAFAIPAPAGEVVIEADRVPAAPAARPARPAASKPAVVVSAARGTNVPVASPRPAAPVAPTSVRVTPPKPLPATTPARQPEPAPAPAPQPLAVRTLASVAPVAEQQNETASKKGKPHKDKGRKDKRKHDKAPKRQGRPAAEPQSEPATTVDPVESLPSDEAEQDKRGKYDDGKEHGDHGKGHDKKK